MKFLIKIIIKNEFIFIIIEIIGIQDLREMVADWDLVQRSVCMVGCECLRVGLAVLAYVHFYLIYHY